MEKKLEIQTPSIQTFLNHAYPLAILEKDEAFLGWYYTNYTQLYTFNNRQNPVGDFKIDFYSHNGKYPNIPFLASANMDGRIIRTFEKSILDIVIENIDLNYYLEVGIDEYYWSNKKSYMQEHFHHDNLIYGYNDKDRVLYYLGYNQDMIFGQYSVSYEEFVLSFTEDPDSTIKFIKNITPELTSKTTKYVYHFNLNFDMDIFRIYLEDFLQSTNSFLTHRGSENSVFGLAIYDELINRFSDDILLSKDMRLYRIIWEHKNVFNKRIDYLNSKGYLKTGSYESLSSKSKSLCNESLLLKNLSMKYSITNDMKVFLKISNKLKEIQLFEEQLVNDLLVSIT
ncbi:hypothetical protein Q9R46_16880 [Paenibacillus sp. RRE4]|uniref:hypothetical protein n=1 Tax=Paenibacillus sp. RRE4 TaxID=2962587 RepID=UPI0028820FA3|nr:hypothetical protein [Paenibacillus sp. RRE4]MDT0124336.1 hypothetical protein [Paenibacillus sp. RRE4]